MTNLYGKYTQRVSGRFHGIGVSLYVNIYWYWESSLALELEVKRFEMVKTAFSIVYF